MLLKLPIILSRNSFYFDPLFLNLFPEQKHPTKSLIYISMQCILLLQNDLWLSQLAKGVFSEIRCYGYK